MNYLLGLSLVVGVSAHDAVDMVQFQSKSPFRTYTDIAIGVHTGGPEAGEAVDALKRTVLRRIPKSLIMGDVADRERGIEEAPSQYACSRTSTFGLETLQGVEMGLSAEGPDDPFTSRGRCTQFRFAYLFLSLRERFPDAKYYFILDSDAWVDVDGTYEMLEASNNSLPWMMGISPVLTEWVDEIRTQVWGPLLIFNRALSERLDPSTLVGCTSYWNFAVDVFEWPPDMNFMALRCYDGFPDCWSRGEAKSVFEECQRVLNATCSHEPRGAFKACTKKLQEDPTNEKCRFEHVHYEYPFPMYANLELWDDHHGDDHFFSFCTLAAVGGTIRAQPRFVWRAPHMDKNEVCQADVLAYHQLQPALVEQIEEVKQSCLPGQEAKTAVEYWERSWDASRKWSEQEVWLTTSNKRLVNQHRNGSKKKTLVGPLLSTSPYWPEEEPSKIRPSPNPSLDADSGKSES